MSTSLQAHRALLCLLFFASACDASAIGALDGAVTPDTAVALVDAGMPDAGDLTAPVVIDYPIAVSAGGPVLTSPVVVPIFFSGEPHQSAVESFLGMLAGSSYWSSVVSEYGVGALRLEASIELSDPPPTTRAELDALLLAHAPADASTVLTVVLLPAGSTYADPDNEGTICHDFDGFHREYATPMGQRVFAVVTHCADPTRFGFTNALDELTGALSHELVEASTDPFHDSAPAYQSMDPAHGAWAVFPFAELGDLCTQEGAAYPRLLGSFVVQRIWSNAASRAGHDPCVPATDTPYFFAAPVVPDEVPIEGTSSPTTHGISLAVGASRTIDVALVADGPMADWQVETAPVAASELSVSITPMHGRAGDTLRLTITRLAPGASNGGSVFALLSAQSLLDIVDTSQPSHFWYGFVANE